MTSQPVVVSKRGTTDQEFSFIEALSLAPNESLTLVSKETLGLPPSPTTPKAALATSTVTPIRPPQKKQYSPPPTLHHPPRAVANKRPVTPQPPAAPAVTDHHNTNMAASSKAQTHCVELCKKATSVGDRVSIRVLEYITTVKHQPQGFDQLAHDFLDTCQILFAIEAGLGEGVRTATPLPLDMISELDKKFRVAQADFTVLEQMLTKFLDFERKGTMGRMRRGWGKIFGGNDIEKMTLALARTRESLRMSALMFQWSLGSEKIDAGMGIGFTGLAAALDRLDQRSGNSNKARSEVGGPTVATPASPYHVAPSNSHSQLRGYDDHAHAPLPPLPWNERASSHHTHDTVPSHQPQHIPSLHDQRSFVTPDHRVTPTRHHTTSSARSTTSSQDRHHSGTTGTFDRMSAFDESHEHVSSEEDSDALLEEVAGIDINSTKAVRIKADPYTMPRWSPRNTAGADAANLKSALISAVRGRNHKLIEQLLDRGVPANTGPDFQALNEAVMMHDSETVRLLLLFGADPNEPDREGLTPLFAAAVQSFLRGATMLLKYGADPNLSAGHDLESPLGVATLGNRVNFAHLLLIYGGDANHMTAEGNTLLIAAINKKTPRRFIDLLLSYGADPNNKSREGKTALFEAIQCGRVDIVTSLLEGGANANLPGPKHMLWPATYHAACLQKLLEHGADTKKTPGIMELAASINNIESVRILLKAGVDPNAKKDGVYTPLCTSIRDNRPDIFQLLLSNKADPNVPASEYPTFKCVTHNRMQYLPQLVAAGATLNNPKGIVEMAVSVNNVEALKWLLEQGLSPNDKNPKGHSPLTTAIRDNRPDMVDLLLSRGADPNTRGQDWPVCMAVRNPPILGKILSVLAEPRAFKGVMEMAVVANQLESVKLLLAAGVSVEDKNGGVFSPLTTAIREDRKDIVKFLLDEGGADVNAPGEHLPIVKALRRFHTDDESETLEHMLGLLLDKGADPNKVYRGWNAMMQAVENGDANILKLLADRCGVDLSARDEMGRAVTEIAASRGWDEAVEILVAGAKR